MKDPTRTEMIDTLLDQSSRLGADLEEAEIAIYWFAMYWHQGQDSNLYEVLSTSPYSPGPMGRLESEGETVQMYYDALEAAYETKEDKQRHEMEAQGVAYHLPMHRGPSDPEPCGAKDPIREGELT